MFGLFGLLDGLGAVEHVNTTGVVAVEDVTVFAKVREKGGDVFGGDVEGVGDLGNGKGGVVAQKLEDVKLFVGTWSCQAAMKMLNDFNELGFVVGAEVIDVVGSGGGGGGGGGGGHGSVFIIRLKG